MREKELERKKIKEKINFLFTSHQQYALYILIINRIEYDFLKKRDKRKKQFFSSSILWFLSSLTPSLPLLIPDVRH
jgi:hypothetical protein